MLKLKSPENKKASPTKAGKANATKVKKVAKKSPKAKQIKAKQDGKVKIVKKVVKGGLVKAPPPDSPKVGSPNVKKVIDAEKLAAIREKRKQKKLEKKLKKIAAKKEAASENGQETGDSEDETKEEVAQNGTATKTSESESAVKPKSPVKSKKKKQKPTNEDKDKPNPLRNTEHTVFVGNLPTNTKRVQLLKVFKEFGTILTIRFRTASGKVIFKHKARKEAGALNAYILYDNEESVVKALERNGFEFKGHHLRVTRTDKPEQNADAKRTIVVGNLKYTATDEKLHQIFSSCGAIDYVRTLQEGDKGCSGVAFVCFKNPDAVGLALELKGTVLDERPINVERYSANKLGARAKKDADGEKKGPTAPKKGKQFIKKGAGAVRPPGNKQKNIKKVGGAKVPANGKIIKNVGEDAKSSNGSPSNEMAKKDGDSPKKPAALAKGKLIKKAGKGVKKTADGKPIKKVGDGAVSADGAESKKKKPEFRGVKTNLIKKKQKKIPSAMKKLAKKIAPKSDD